MISYDKILHDTAIEQRLNNIFNLLQTKQLSFDFFLNFV